VVGLLSVVVVSCLPIVGSAQVSEAADPSDPVIKSAALELNYRLLSPTRGIEHSPTGWLTLEIDMPATWSPSSASNTDIIGVHATYGAENSGSFCYEATYSRGDFEDLGTLKADGTHVLVAMPIFPCFTNKDDHYVDQPGVYTLGVYSRAPSQVPHSVSIAWGEGSSNAVMAAPADVQQFHLWSDTRISESTSLVTFDGRRYRNLAGTLIRWDAPAQKWRRFAGAKVSLGYTPPGSRIVRWVSSKNTASDGSYRFRTANTKPGTWSVSFSRTVHYQSCVRSLTIR